MVNYQQIGSDDFQEVNEGSEPEELLNPFEDQFNDADDQRQLLDNTLSKARTTTTSNKDNKLITNQNLDDLKIDNLHNEHINSSTESDRGPSFVGDEDDEHDPVKYRESEYVDDFGNRYDHLNFNLKEYTRKLRFKGNTLVYFTSAFVSLFVSLFGYEQGVCSGILTFTTFTMYFNKPTATEIGLIISVLEIGAMISSLLVAKMSDSFGKKKTILIGTFIFMIGGTLQSFAVNLYIFSVGRVLSGFGVGILSTVVPSYQCEISPSEERGKLVCGEFTGNISGYALSVWVDYFCYFIQNVGDARKNPHSFAANLSWRLPLFIQVIIAFILFLGGFFIVESPRYLLDIDHDQQGFNVLSLLYDSSREYNKPITEFFMIKNSILNERILIPKYERSWKNMFKNYFTRVMVGCSAFAFAQFNGINIISYYAPMVFGEAGFNDSNALLMTGINAIFYFLSTIPPWFLADKWGRKPILISGGLMMAICLYLIAFIMYLDKSFTPRLVALLVIIYNAAFGYSWGPLGFLIPPEVFPLAIRSKGVSIATATNWLANYIVGQMTPILQVDIGWGLYLFPASSCIISIVVVYFFYPETKGLELEDIDRVFNEFYKVEKPKMNEYIEVNRHNELELDELDELDYETDFQLRQVL